MNLLQTHGPRLPISLPFPNPQTELRKLRANRVLKEVLLLQGWKS